MICVFFKASKSVLNTLTSMTALLECDKYFSTLKEYEEYVKSLSMSKRLQMNTLFF